MKRRSLLPAYAAGGFLLLVTLGALFAPLLAPFNPNVGNFLAAFDGPSATHLLGTDELGRDIFTRVMYGGRVSLVGVGEAVAIFLILGLLIGLLAGYRGGLIDDMVVWIAELSFGTPQIVVVFAVLAILANNGTAAMLIYGFLGAPGLAMMVRGATTSVKQEQYIAAATVSGLGGWRIVWRHIVPRIIGPVIVLTTFFAGGALVFQTGLDFLGLGTQPPTASWGAMVAEASENISRDGWMVIPSGLVIALTIVSFGIIGDAVRDSRAGLSAAPMPNVVGIGAGPARSTQLVAVPMRAMTLVGGDADRQASRDNASLDGDAVLSVRHLSAGLRTRGGYVPIVEDLSFDLRSGDTLGLVGESGCGKTMMLLAVMGMLPPGVHVTDGAMMLGGKELRHDDERDLRAMRGSEISMIFQEPIASLDPSFTVGSQLREVVRKHTTMSRTAADAQVLNLLERVRLPEPRLVAKRFPHQVSGGMAQRVAIAAALAGNPRVLFADEPTTALDVTVQAEILDLLRSVQKEAGLAVLLVSHDWGVIADTCDSAMVMYAGQIVEAAGIDEIFEDPRHPYTRGLMMSDPHRVHEPRTKLPAVPGSVIPVGMWPEGCRFAERCEFATDECRVSSVPTEVVRGHHAVRCIHNDRVASKGTLGLGGVGDRSVTGDR